MLRQEFSYRECVPLMFVQTQSQSFDASQRQERIERSRHSTTRMIGKKTSIDRVKVFSAGKLAHHGGTAGTERRMFSILAH